MNNAFDAVDFALYLRTRWRVAVICCASALLIAGIAGKVLPKRYTATATLIIQPPAGSDPRVAQAVSPVYLESLKTYENFATSNTLFSRALGELGLRQEYPNADVEALKRSVLNVSKPNTTRILEISATLHDPLAADRLARFIAEQTVATNRSLEEHSWDGAVGQAEKNVQDAETRLRDAIKAGSSGNDQTVDALADDLKSASDLKYEVQTELAHTRTELADLLSQRNSFPAGDENAASNARDITATTARVHDLDEQETKLEAAVVAKEAVLERVRPRANANDAELELARSDAETARTKLSELRASSGFRGEQLEVLDPGVVPERPSYPNVPLIVLVAFAVSLMASLAYLAAAFGYGRAMSARAERTYHMR